MAGRATGDADARVIIHRLISVLERTPKGELLTWDLSDSDEIRIRIDGQDLTEVLGNVLDNAMRYARETVTIRTTAEANETTIEIIDDGPGIPHDKIDFVLGRGGRLDETSGGAGLGLAIANDIATAAGGSLSIENADPGLNVAIRFPAGAR